MTLPIFSASDDPGPSFAELLRRTGSPAQVSDVDIKDRLEITHGTTVVAVRYADGVVMAGDRRATSGNLISHRTMEKVYAADRHSGVAIAGAGRSGDGHGEALPTPARALREGRGQRAQPRRQGQPTLRHGAQQSPGGHARPRRRPAVRGLRHASHQGRLFQYDVTGGRYEETNFATTGSGSLHAGTVIKLGYRDSLNREETIDLAISALFNAADEDSRPVAPTSCAASTRRWRPSPIEGSRR